MVYHHLLLVQDLALLLDHHLGLLAVAIEIGLGLLAVVELGFGFLLALVLHPLRAPIFSDSLNLSSPTMQTHLHGHDHPHLRAQQVLMHVLCKQ